MKTRRIPERKLIFDQSGLEAFAAQLKKVRYERGFTQSQLAFESGISMSQIARIETARINPTISTIFVLARTMGVTLPELFNFQI
jgi:transcriptional regulator with XRE-family HTH domain